MTEVIPADARIVTGAATGAALVTAVQDAPHREHKGTGTIHIPKKFLGGCDDPEFYMAPLAGDCLMPEINPDDYVLVSPAATPEAGDFVIIWLVKGKPMAKRLTFGLLPAPAPESELMPMLVFEQINPQRSFWLPMDKVRAVHKVIGVLKESAEPGWREDGLYSHVWENDFRAVDWIKVRTKKGALRKEPLGGVCRYDGQDGKLVRQVTLRLFEASAAADLERLAGRGLS